MYWSVRKQMEKKKVMTLKLLAEANKQEFEL